ncbi:MAG: amidohydrolase [Rubrivivax sp.]|nr:amidohydrolase [Rubrivivax sp.]
MRGPTTPHPRRRTTRERTVNRRLQRAASVAALAFALPAAAQTVADRIWSGGTILTMNDQAMRAEAVAEAGGRIVAVGRKADVMKLRAPGTQLIDLKGRTMLPGFVDAHGHVMLGGLQALSANLLAPPDGEVRDIASLQNVLREWIAANEQAVRKVNLIVGFGYDNATLAEQRHPTRDDLDQVSRDVPIVLLHQSGHIIAVNSKAIEVAGITADTPDPQGGVIVRQRGSREPNGVFEELAAFPVVMKLMGQVGPEGFKAFARAGAELWSRYGYTTADEGRSVPGTAQILRQVADEGGFKIDVATYSDVLADKAFIEQNLSPTYRNRFRVAGAKLTIDGSPQGFTAWRDRPYYAPAGDYPKGYAGYASATPEQVLDATDWAYAKGIQLLTHANGERASDLLISALTVAEMKHGAGKDRRPVLIHGQFLREDQVDAYRRLGVHLSLFPMHTFYWGDWHASKTVGPALAQNISPTGWVRKRGMIFSTHHDAPVAFPDSMRVLDATVTRVARGSGQVIGPDQRVDVITALKAMTIWPAWQHREETTKGSIEVGKLADFAILSRDPTRGDPKTIHRIKVTETIKEGATVFAATPEEQRRADLTSKPAANGGDAFARAMQAMAMYRELEGRPAFMKTPEVRRHLASLPHDASCLGALFGDMTAAMLAGARPGGR